MRVNTFRSHPVDSFVRFWLSSINKKNLFELNLLAAKKIWRRETTFSVPNNSLCQFSVITHSKAKEHNVNIVIINVRKQKIFLLNDTGPEPSLMNEVRIALYGLALHIQLNLIISNLNFNYTSDFGQPGRKC